MRRRRASACRSRALVHWSRETAQEGLLVRTPARAEHQQGGIALDPDRIQHMSASVTNTRTDVTLSNEPGHRPAGRTTRRQEHRHRFAPLVHVARKSPSTALGAGKNAKIVAAVLATRLTNLWSTAASFTSSCEIVSLGAKRQKPDPTFATMGQQIREE